MRTRTLVSTVAAATVALLTVAVASATAKAPPPYHIYNGPPSSGVAYQFQGPALNPAPRIKFYIAGNTSPTFWCVSGLERGDLVTGVYSANPYVVAQLHGPQMTYNTCTGPGGAWQINGLQTWDVQASNGNGSSNVTGQILNVGLRFTRASCSFTLMGQVPFRFLDTTPATLVLPTGFPAGLTVTGATGSCPVTTSTPMRYEARYRVIPTSGPGPIQIY